MKDTAKAITGSLGGKERVRLYGNPGTPEGRRLGGSRSLKIHAYLNTGFKLLRSIQIPEPGIELAELMGILAGDGHLDIYQVSVTTNSETDMDHAEYVRLLLETVFSIPVSVRKIRARNAVVVCLSSKAACDFLESAGMVRGNKVKNQIDVPAWILEEPALRRAYMRGLIDTDGCVYQDRHTVKGIKYESTCIAFTNASEPLLHFIENQWKAMGYHPTRFGRHVRLRRRKEVLSHAKDVGFSNPKHARKIGV